MEERIEAALKLHDGLVEEMKEALIAIGYPSESIVKEKGVDVEGRKYIADLIVMGEEETSLRAVFEMKTGLRGPVQAFINGKRSLRNLPQRFPCFIVTKVMDKCCLASARENTPKWVEISDQVALLKLLGHYANNSPTRGVDKESNAMQLSREDWKTYLLFVGISGCALTSLYVILEACGCTITWKPGALFVTVALLCAAFSGKFVHAKFSSQGAEVTIFPVDQATRIGRVLKEIED